MLDYVRRFFHAVLILSVAIVLRSAGAGERDLPAGPYPLGLQLQVLERDLSSADYHAVLETMIPTDLAAEWLRIASPDNHMTFLKAHGGKAKVLADRQLKAAYERRLDIATRFLEMMRAAYQKRGVEKIPFDEVNLEEMLLEAANVVASDRGSRIPVRVVMSAPGAERNWTRFRGSSGQGIALQQSFPLHWSGTENIAWKTALPGKGHGSPVIWGDRIFVTCEGDERTQRLLLCYSRIDGSLLWQYSAPPAGEQENLYWKNTFASSTPVTDGERVIAFFGNSGLVCCDMQGKLVWHYPLGPFGITHGPGTSPVLYRDKVIFIQDQNRDESVFLALDKRTGEKLWQQSREKAMCWSTPVVLRVGDHDELVYNGSFNVIAYDPDTGEELWRFAGTTRESIPTIVVGGGLIYSASGRNGPILAIHPGGRGDVSNTHLAWLTTRGGPHVPSPVYFESRLYIVNDTGILSCIDASSGQTIWQQRLRGRFSMSPIEAGGKLILTNEEGHTYVLRAGDEYEVLAENDLGEPVLATPAVLGGHVYFRTSSSLLCIGG